MVDYNESINPNSILGQRKTIISIPILYFGTEYNNVNNYSPIAYNLGTDLINQISNNLTSIDKGKNLLLSYNNSVILPNLGFSTGENWVYCTIYDSLFVRIKKIDDENVVFLSNMLYGKNYSVLYPFLTGTATHAPALGSYYSLFYYIRDLYNNALREGVIANSTDYNSNSGYIGYYNITNNGNDYLLNLSSNGNYQSFTISNN